MSDTFTCAMCECEFLESQRQDSHDVPRYIGGTDKDGRHMLCKRCHDIYEKLVFSVMVKPLPEEIKQKMRETAKAFARRYLSD